jgi:hypothetical protein
MPYNNNLIYLFILSLSLFAASCATGRKLKISAPPERTAEELLNALNSRNYDFRYFVGKATAKFATPDEKASGSMEIRIARDSVVWMHIKKFGIEAARILITPDSFTTIYRLEKAYEQNRLENMQEFLPFPGDFEDIQNLMFGNVMFPDFVDTTRISFQGGVYTIPAFFNESEISYSFEPYQMHLVSMVMKSEDWYAEILLGDYKMLDNCPVPVPFSRQSLIRYNKGYFSEFILDFKDIVVDEPPLILFTIPAHYDRISR